METLDFSHSPLLVFASLLVAMIAGFTGFSLTNELSGRSVAQRKILIVLAAIALGSGIWSMHFVAMLGLQLPILFYYDAAITLTSALVAILVVGVAFLILHFWPRTRARLVLAGMIVGLGVLAMHYLGMSAMELCRALYTPLGIALAIVSSCGLSIAAFGIAYGKRTQRNILLGTVFFGFAVFTVHFIAIGGTRFVAIDSADATGPLMSNETLAIGVVLSSFLLCGAFLLTGVTFLQPTAAAPGADTVSEADPNDDIEEPEETAPVTPKPPVQTQIPYEQEGRTLFINAEAVGAIRAEGHYTHLYTQTEKLFCVWSITEAERRLAGGPFLRSHRSYLINPSFVSGFERLKDNGVCYFDMTKLAKAPISRSRLKDVRAVLGV